MINLPEKCLRNRGDCEPLSQIASDCGKSFICCGRNNGEGRQVAQDCFTVCWKNQFVDTRDFWDKRDITDTASVLVQALSIEENSEEPSIGEAVGGNDRRSWWRIWIYRIRKYTWILFH